jgi:hypothetical protein
VEKIKENWISILIAFFTILCAIGVCVFIPRGIGDEGFFMYMVLAIFLAISSTTFLGGLYFISFFIPKEKNIDLIAKIFLIQVGIVLLAFLGYLIFQLFCILFFGYTNI